MKDEDEVQALLTHDLAINQTTQHEVLSFLEQQDVLDECNVSDEEIRCWVPTRPAAIDSKNPLRVVPLNLLFSKGASYHICFDFEDDKLSGIEVALDLLLP